MFFFIFIYIKTFGCSINYFDSEKNLNLLKYFKLKINIFFFKCEIFLINTCIIRKNPEIKILKELKKIFFLKKYKKNIILLTGCLTESNFINFDKLKVDIYYNSLSNFYLNKLIIFYVKTKKKIFFLKKKNNFFIKNNVNNYIYIMKGCNHNCTYCVIPQIKGSEKYFSFKYIINNILSNIKKKFYEITLLGQNVNSYFYKNINFNSLIFNISKIKNIKRINFFSSNIKDFNKEYFFLYKNILKISKHLHIPIQSGSNNILKKMNRKYSINEYLLFIKNISFIKKTSFSTDVILSFPNEKFFDFDKTIQICKKISFFEIFYFLYSKRKNTISYNFKEDNHELKTFKIKTFQKNIKKNFNLLLNKIERVLVIGYIKNNIFIGKMDNLKLVFFEFYNFNIIGKFLLIKIVCNKKNFFLGIYENIFINF